MFTPSPQVIQQGKNLQSVGGTLIFLSLAVIYFWFGGMKFTAVEAKAIEGLVSSSPILGWVYNILSVHAFAASLGVLELLIGLLILGRFVSPKLSAVGGLLSMGLFIVTVSFMLSTPGVWVSSLGGFPAISVMPAQFLLKDIALFSASLWVLGESLAAMESGGNG